MGEGPIREITASGSLTLAIAAVAVHTGAMLAVTGVMASGVCRGVMRLLKPRATLSFVTPDLER